MGEVEMFIACPIHWDLKKSYLIVKKVISKLSNGREFIGYEVLNRVTVCGYEKKLLVTESLKGMHYNKNEVNIISEFTFIEYLKLLEN